MELPANKGGELPAFWVTSVMSLCVQNKSSMIKTNNILTKILANMCFTVQLFRSHLHRSSSGCSSLARSNQPPPPMDMVDLLCGYPGPRLVIWRNSNSILPAWKGEACAVKYNTATVNSGFYPVRYNVCTLIIHSSVVIHSPFIFPYPTRRTIKLSRVTAFLSILYNNPFL